MSAIVSILIALLFAWMDCTTAFNHRHDRLKDAEVVISAWNGCAVTGTIGGVSTPLFMDVAACPLHAKVPGRFRIRYDQSCGAIVEITDGPAITTPMPPACPSPIPTPTPVPGSREVTGYLKVDGEYFKERAIVTASHPSIVAQIFSAESGGFYRFDLIPVGSVLTAKGAGYIFGPVPVDSGLYFILHGKAAPSPSPSPTAVPSPTPTPTPVSTPTPRPSPTPPVLPTCRRDEVVGSPPKCLCTGQLVGNPRRCKPR